MAQINSLVDLVNLLRRNSDTLTEHDIEQKYTRLSLAFKTDRLTLENRLGIQQRQRDDAEHNVDREIGELRSKLNRLQQQCQEPETIEELSLVQRQVAVLAQSATSVSRAAEMYGAVQQEERVARAVDVILAHVENLRRAHSKEHTELEEARRLLQEVSSEDRPGEEGVTLRGGSRGLRAQQLQSVQANARRRASIAALPRSASPAEQRFASIVDATRARLPARAVAPAGLPDSGRRTSLNARADTISTDCTSAEPAALSRMRREASEASQASSEGELTGSAGGELAAGAPVAGLEVPVAALMQDEELSAEPSASEDELQDELLYEGDELRLRRSQAALDPALCGALLERVSAKPSLRMLASALSRRVRSLRWPWSAEQSVLMLRRGATAVLLVLAALTMLLVLVPAAAVVYRGARVVNWSPLVIELPSEIGDSVFVHLQQEHGPPPV